MNGEIRELLDSKIPGEIAALEEAASGLELVAAFAEANYGQAPHKQQAFNETKRLTLQSLASVAYYVNSLSKSLLRSLELENEKLAIKANEAVHLDQQVAIQKEKMARREIGKLTANKSINRSSKIVYPTIEEKAPKYQRTGIDYSLLDDIGHGRKVYGGSSQQGFHLGRTGSMTSSDSAQGMQNVNTVEKIYASRASNPGGVYSTLTRNSTRQPMAIDQNHQYRVPQAIPSALQRPNQLPMNGGNIYAHATMEVPDCHSRYSTMTTNMASAYARGYNMVAADAAAAAHHQQQPPQSHHLYHGGPDGFGQRHLYQHDTVHPDDPLPPPPNSMLPSEAPPLGALVPRSTLNDDWVPRSYIEKDPSIKPTLTNLARVVYAYEANRPDELTLCENEIVYILRKNEDGWYEGVMNGVTGLFPGNYVQTVVS